MKKYFFLSIAFFSINLLGADIPSDFKMQEKHVTLPGVFNFSYNEENIDLIQSYVDRASVLDEKFWHNKGTCDVSLIDELSTQKNNIESKSALLKSENNKFMVAHIVNRIEFTLKMCK